ncbi:MAG: Fused nickel transport protein NikMN [Pelotomaculum sp. PtaU1.Bin035]|nr:MAG: Fused nickel transport protein NikMN [Pelotomaculum sp. PtaU1.Bin035]
MHIPDGYLSPQTCAVMGAVMLPVWAAAAKKVNNVQKTKYAPLMAIGAAFTFVIMMFNIPVPDGTTAHAVGGGLLAIVLGPWAACISITIALAVQALLFGDGGILAFGANTFNMALLLPFSAYYTYRLIAGNSEAASSRRWLGGLAGGYIGVNLAALAAAVEFGLQPVLFHAADGAALYCPYPLSMAVPAMALAHLSIAGPVEGVITALAIRYLQERNAGILSVEASSSPLEGHSYKKLMRGLGMLILLSPLGLLAKGTAWGEWAAGEIEAKMGFIPGGMSSLAERWQAPLPDYGLPGFEHNLLQSSTVYIVSAIIGLGIIFAITYIFSLVQKKTTPDKT